MKALPLFALVLGLTACGGKEALRKLTAPPPPVSGLTLAVLPPADETGDAKAAPYVASAYEVLSTQLSTAARLVERRKLESVVDELRLGASGAVDPASAVRIGGLAGAHVLAACSVSRAGAAYRLSLRLIQTESGLILGAGSRRVSSLGRLEEAAFELATESAAILRRSAGPAAEPAP